MKKMIFGSIFLSVILYAQSGELVIDGGVGQNNIPLEQIRKIYFTTEETHALVITEKDGGTRKYKLQNINRIHFTQSPLSVNSNIQNPISFALYQNFPNPFNPLTRIHCVIAQSGWVDLSIYNIKGQLVRHLNSAYLDPGHYEFEWAGTDTADQAVPSGIYFCRICQNRQTTAIKMLLSR